MFSLASQAALIAVIVGLTSTVAVLLRSRGRFAVRYALFAASATGFYTVSLLRSLAEVSVYDPLHICAAALVLVSGTAFFQSMLSDHGVLAIRRGRLSWLAAITLVAIAASPLSSSVAARAAAAILAIGLLGSLVWTMEVRAREVKSRTDRWRLRYVAVGGAVVLVGVTSDLLAGLHVPVPPLGGAATAVYLYLLSQSLLQQRLLDLHELLGKLVVYACLALTLAAIYSSLVLWAASPGLIVFNTLTASAIILILFDPVRRWLEVSVARLLFSRQRGFCDTLAELAAVLPRQVELEPALDQLLNAAYESRRASHCSYYRITPDRVGLELVTFRGPRPETRLAPAQERVLLDTLEPGSMALQLEALRRPEDTSLLNAESQLGANSSERQQTLIAALEAMRADLCVPVVGDAQLIGVLNLGDETRLAPFSTDEIVLLERVAALLGVIAANSRILLQMRQRDQMALLGQVASGIAQELHRPARRLLTHLDALQASALDDRGREVMAHLSAEAKHVTRTVEQFVRFASPPTEEPAPLDLNQVVRECVEERRATEAQSPMQIELDLAEALPLVNGSAAQLRLAVDDLIQNGIDVTPEGGRLLLRTEHVTSSMRADPGTAALRVIDQGPGIPPEQRSQVLTPFFSTKPGALGLGLPTCRRIAESHGGRLAIRNLDGAGCEVSLHLPVISGASADVRATPRHDAPTA